MGNWGETMAGRGQNRKLIPSMRGMEDTMYHMPAIQIDAVKDRGWWEVRVRCEPNGPFYSGKKDRSYFSALAKSLDKAMVKTHHKAE